MTPTNTTRDYFLSNKLYDVLKFITLVVLPALGTLYFTLANIWGLPAAEQVLGSVTALCTFLGITLKLGDKSYNNSEGKYDGFINIEPKDDGGTSYSLNLNGDPELINDATQITFKVNPKN